MRIPNDVKFNQANEGDFFGSLWATRNIDFDKKRGVLALSKRAYPLIQDPSSASTLGMVMSIVYLFDKWWFCGHNDIYYSNNDLTSLTEDSASGHPGIGLGGDAVAWQGSLYATTNNAIKKRTSTTWSDPSMTSITFTSGLSHPLCVNWDNSLLIGDANIVYRKATDDSNTTVVTLPSEYEIKWIRVGNHNAYIGTKNTTNGDAAVFLWDGAASNYNQYYPVKGSWCFSGVWKDGSLYVVTNIGKLQVLDANGFRDVTQFPNYIEDFKYIWANSNFAGMITQRGMQVINGKITINIDSYHWKLDSSSGSDYIFPQMPAGVWIYDEEIGLYHKMSPSNSTTTNDNGQVKVVGYAGAISELYTGATAPIGYQTDLGVDIVTGAGLFRGNNTDYYYTIQSLVEGNNRGYFITSRFNSSQVKDDFQKIFVKFNSINSTSDQIIIKYRTTYKEPLYLSKTISTSSITWTWSNSNTFTTTSDLSTVEVGDEVEVMTGGGAGTMAHVLTISSNGGTWTVVLDEDVTGSVANEVGGAIIQNFKKLPAPAITYPETDFREFPVNIASKWIQFKVELRGNRPEVEEFNFINSTNQKAV